MKRIALIAASSIAVLASSFALAQPQPVPPVGGDKPQQQTDSRDEWREKRAERMKARLDERLGHVRDELKLRPEQVPMWDKLEALIRQRSAERGDHWSQMREGREKLRHADIMERIDARAQRLGERANTAKELADTVRPLWTTLSDEQKTVLRRSVRDAMAAGHERGQGMQGQGMRGQEMRGDREMRGGRDRYDRENDDRGSRDWRDDRRGGQDGQSGYRSNDERRGNQGNQGHDGNDDE